MFRFFRYIRKSFIDSNNTRKYLLYAFGEIFLVVIGILIALQINNWNEERKVRIEEKIYLQRLLDEMVLDSSRLERKILLSQYKIDGSYYILEELEKANRTALDSFELVIQAILIGVNVNNPPDLSTYEELSTTGKLNIIRNEDIKSKLSRYNRSVDHYGSETNSEFGVQITAYKKHLYHYFSALIADRVFQYKNLSEVKKLGINVMGYLDHPETIYHVRNITLGYKRINIKSRGYLDDIVNPLIQLIHEELEK